VRHLAAALVFCAPASFLAAQSVTRVRAQQLPDRKVEVLYDLSGAETGGATVGVAFSSDGGASFPIAPQPSTLSGQFGSGIPNGTDRRIVWEASAQLPAGTFGTNYRAAVTATNPTAPTPTPTPTPTPPPSGPCVAPTTVTLPGNVPMELACIKAGSFPMGSPEEELSHQINEQPLHGVTISQDFYLGRTEVTQRQWRAVMGALPNLNCQVGTAGVGDDYPVYCVSWTDAAGPNGFLQKLNQLLGTDKFRLPTEAEWEYAARARSVTRFFFGDALNCDETCGPCASADQYLWWCGNNSPYGTKLVGRKLPNAWGLLDTLGGVGEWVKDYYHPEYYDGSPSVDPPGPSVGLGTNRVIRGGSWIQQLQYCRPARRSFGDQDNRYGDTGFRVARSQ